LSSTLAAFRYDERNGNLRQTQTISTLPPDFAGDNAGADVHVGTSGRYVYASNRGHESIVVFHIDPESEELSLVQHQSAYGRTPRSFVIDPTGRFLLAGNQDSGTVVAFAIEPETGRLSPTGHMIEIPTPACLLFYVPHD